MCAAAVRADRRRGRDRRQQQRRRRAAGAQHAGEGPRGDRLARRADRDRRRVPHARHHGARRRQAGRGRHHQPHASARTMPPRSAPKTGLILKVHTSNYRDRRLHHSRCRARELAPLARERGVPLWTISARGTLVDLARFGLRARADGRGSRRRRRRSRHLLRRQAAGRPAGRLHRRPQGSDRAHQPQSDEARAARRQDPAGRARSDAASSIAIPTGSRSGCRPCALLARPQRGDRRRWRDASRRAVAAGVWQPTFVVERDGVREPDRLGRAAGRDAAERRARDPADRGARGRARCWRRLAARCARLPIPVIGRIEDGR